MRHRVSGYKLSRNTAHRRAMWRNMAISLFTHGQITTTVTKAKSVRPFVEKLITTARKGDLASRRRVLAVLRDPIMVKHEDDPDVERNRYGEVISGPRLVKKLFDEIGPRYVDRPGGYTRIVRLGKHRIGDGGDLCVLQLVGDEKGPQVSGQYSRRRQKADHRMEYAARLRRGGTEAAVATAELPEEPQPQTTAEEPTDAIEEDAGSQAEAETSEEK